MQLPFTSAKDRLPSPDARSQMDAPINCLIPEETRRRRVGWFRPVPSPAWHDTGSVKGSERRNSLVDQDTRASSSTSPHLKFRAAKGHALAVPNNLGARTTPAFACCTTELPNPERLLPIRDTQQCQEGDAFRPLLRRTTTSRPHCETDASKPSRMWKLSVWPHGSAQAARRSATGSLRVRHPKRQTFAGPGGELEGSQGNGGRLPICKEGGCLAPSRKNQIPHAACQRCLAHDMSAPPAKRHGLPRCTRLP